MGILFHWDYLIIAIFLIMFIEKFQERVHRSGSDSDLCIEETEINAAGDHVSTFPQQHRVGLSVLLAYYALIF